AVRERVDRVRTGLPAREHLGDGIARLGLARRELDRERLARRALEVGRAVARAERLGDPDDVERALERLAVGARRGGERRRRPRARGPGRRVSWTDPRLDCA